MDEYILADLQAACSNLGKYNQEKNVYEKYSDCTESLKDIIRHLRRDDPSHEVRRALGVSNIMKTDLLPLLTRYYNSSDILSLVLRLIVDLTYPVTLLYEDEVPVEKRSASRYHELICISQQHKQDFIDVEVWKVLAVILKKVLNIETAIKGDDDWERQEMVLVLARNVLHAPPDDFDVRKPDDEVTVHDQVVWAMYNSEFTSLLTFMAIEKSQSRFCFHIFEIIHQILREYDPCILAKTTGTSNQTEEEKKRLKELVEREKARSEAEKKATPAISRFARFSGTFVLKNVKSISDNDMIIHAGVPKENALDLDKSKKLRLRAKNRRPVEDKSVLRSSTLNIRRVLKDFISQFLNEAFNVFMELAIKSITRAEQGQHDESHFYFVLSFFIAFNRCGLFDVSAISKVLSKDMFHTIQSYMYNCYEMMTSDKRKIVSWIKRLHAALKAYSELLKTVALMDASTENVVKNAAKVLKGHLFYMPEYRDFILHLLLNYNRNVQNFAFLSTVAEVVHNYLKMLENFTKIRGHVVVASRGKSKKKPNKPRRNNNNIPAGRLNSMWLEVSPMLTDVLEGVCELPSDVVPFDATLEMGMEAQKVRTLHSIQTKLRSRNLTEAVALYRASREVWPESDVFGSELAEPEEEFMSLRHLFFTDLSGAVPAEADHGNEEEDDEEEDEDEPEHVQETNFEFNDFVKRFASYKVLIAYQVLLHNFEKNTTALNHYTVKMLHRIGFDLKMAPMLFQISYFMIFDKIFKAARANPGDSMLKELCNFAKYITRCFVELAPNNDLILVECLFWKSTKSAYEIQYGYGETEKVRNKSSWSEEENAELQLLYETYKDSISPGEDIVDVIQRHLSNDSRTRRQILMQLKHLEIIDTSWKSNKRKNQSRKRRRSVQDSDSEQAQQRTREDDEVVENISDDELPSQAPPRETDRFIRSSNVLSSNDLDQLSSIITGCLESDDRRLWLEWVKDFMESTFSDWKDKDNESVPLVPLMPDEHDALENEEFCTLLSLLGFDPPRTHEEQYWRLPSSLKKDELEKNLSMLKDKMTTNSTA